MSDKLVSLSGLSKYNTKLFEKTATTSSDGFMTKEDKQMLLCHNTVAKKAIIYAAINTLSAKTDVGLYCITQSSNEQYDYNGRTMGYLLVSSDYGEHITQFYFGSLEPKNDTTIWTSPVDGVNENIYVRYKPSSGSWTNWKRYGGHKYKGYVDLGPSKWQPTTFINAMKLCGSGSKANFDLPNNSTRTSLGLDYGDYISVTFFESGTSNIHDFICEVIKENTSGKFRLHAIRYNDTRNSVGSLSVSQINEHITSLGYHGSSKEQLPYGGVVFNSDASDAIKGVSLSGSTLHPSATVTVNDRHITLSANTISLSAATSSDSNHPTLTLNNDKIIATDVDLYSVRSTNSIAPADAPLVIREVNNKGWTNGVDKIQYNGECPRIGFTWTNSWQKQLLCNKDMFMFLNGTSDNAWADVKLKKLFCNDISCANAVVTNSISSNTISLVTASMKSIIASNDLLTIDVGNSNAYFSDNSGINLHSGGGDINLSLDSGATIWSPKITLKTNDNLVELDSSGFTYNGRQIVTKDSAISKKQFLVTGGTPTYVYDIDDRTYPILFEDLVGAIKTYDIIELVARTITNAITIDTMFNLSKETYSNPSNTLLITFERVGYNTNDYVSPSISNSVKKLNLVGVTEGNRGYAVVEFENIILGNTTLRNNSNDIPTSKAVYDYVNPHIQNMDNNTQLLMEALTALEEYRNLN